jgi:hypothetical protein
VQLPGISAFLQRADCRAEADVELFRQRFQQRTHAGRTDKPRVMLRVGAQARLPFGRSAVMSKPVDESAEIGRARGDVLRAMVEAVAAFDASGSETAADAAAFIEQCDSKILLLQCVRAADAGHPGADDGDAGRVSFTVVLHALNLDSNNRWSHARRGRFRHAAALRHQQPLRLLPRLQPQPAWGQPAFDAFEYPLCQQCQNRRRNGPFQNQANVV